MERIVRFLIVWNLLLMTPCWGKVFLGRTYWRGLDGEQLLDAASLVIEGDVESISDSSF
jgi:hypothetical protein